MIIYYEPDERSWRSARRTMARTLREYRKRGLRFMLVNRGSSYCAGRMWLMLQCIRRVRYCNKCYKAIECLNADALATDEYTCEVCMQRSAACD